MRILTLATGLVAVLLAPLLFATPSAGPAQADSGGPAPVVLFRRLTLRDGRSRYEASQLAQRLENYQAANYGDVTSVHVLEQDFGDDWCAFAEFEGLNQLFATMGRQRGDEGMQALVAEMEATFSSDPDLTILFPLNGVGAGDGRVIRLLKVTRTPDSMIPRARQYARRLATYLSAKYDLLQVRTFSTDLSHDPGCIYWFFDCSGGNPGWESLRLQLLEDEEYVQLSAEGAGLFLDEETTNEVLTP